MNNHETQNTHDDIFEIMTGADSAVETIDAPPAMLLGNLWLTGEISVMFSDVGCGTSLLGVQVGDSIARGVPIEPFEMTAKPQPVIYLDLEHSRSQFWTRYSAEQDKPGVPTKRHTFNKNFTRVSIKDDLELSPKRLSSLIQRFGGRVLIIDNIAYLQRYPIPRETALVMRELRRLRARFGLSILVLAHTTRTHARRGIVASDMACAGVMTNFADNIFAVGSARSEISVRYIKHVKPGSDALAYGAAHVPWFRIGRSRPRFPAFEFQGFTTEEHALRNDGGGYEWDTIREIKRQSLRGETVREIAIDLNMSKSTVHRYLKMAPADFEQQEKAAAKVAEPVFYMFEKCIYERCFGCGTCSRRAGNSWASTPGNINGHSRTDCPDNCDICGPLRYSPDDDKVDPRLKKLSDDFYERLRDWLIAGKQGPRPSYPGQRRYGIQECDWYPGSENWTMEQRQTFRNGYVNRPC